MTSTSDKVDESARELATLNGVLQRLNERKDVLTVLVAETEAGCQRLKQRVDEGGSDELAERLERLQRKRALVSERLAWTEEAILHYTSQRKRVPIVCAQETRLFVSVASTKKRMSSTLFDNVVALLLQHWTYHEVTTFEEETDEDKHVYARSTVLAYTWDGKTHSACEKDGVWYVPASGNTRAGELLKDTLSAWQALDPTDSAKLQLLKEFVSEPEGWALPVLLHLLFNSTAVSDPKHVSKQ